MAAPFALLLLAAASSQAPRAPAEMRGLWVVRTALTSPAAVDEAVDEAQRAGFNALFVQVRGRGDAFYRSDLVPRSELLANQPAGFDPFGRLVERARLRGLKVHAWLNVLLCAGLARPLPAGHIATLHPDWVMVPRAAARAAQTTRGSALLSLISRSAGADVEGLYLSPSAPGVGDHVEAVVREVLRGYPVEGLHLDFIRYPAPDFDYSRAALEGFAARLGLTGDRLEATDRAPAEWGAYRRDVLTALVERLSRAARAERPRLVVSAAVVPDEAQAKTARFQDWPAWTTQGTLDAVCPMVYTPDSRIYLEQVKGALARVGPGRTVWAGVGAYRLDVDGVIERVRMARAAGTSGVVIFSHESLRPADLDRLRQGAFPAVAIAPLPAALAVAGGNRSR
jgi:uncharacterized lipoprotein YddW (UPF0748 family)